MASNEIAVDLQLLGTFRLRAGGVPLRIVPASQRLLAFLALLEHPVPRQAVAAALWPRATVARAASCLRSTLWRLVTPPHQLVTADTEVLTVAPSVRVDVVQVRHFATGIAHHHAGTAPEPGVLAALTMDLLPGWEESWVQTERDWFRQLRLRTLETLSERFRLNGDHLRAHEAALAAVHGDPLRESAHRRLIELHLADGNPAEAVRQFRSYRDLLRTELGLVPSPEIHRLVQVATSAGR
ncbi:BTAD domain-containing putative transcriptional regulator [Actinocrispum sp. NPDC049592]|uniref:AfsR/SARP family transcriptional regulator n=1 Tax=Actinocrispum sp. NPDC049592 TaxID=3154835 RepID=UPI00341AE09C